MMFNENNNEKKIVKLTSEMNDIDYITTILEVEKSLLKNYTIALTEASNQELYDVYYNMFGEISLAQREIYNFMFKMGWYSIEAANEDKIIRKLNMFRENFKELQDDNN